MWNIAKKICKITNMTQEQKEVWIQIGNGTTLRMNPEGHQTHLKNQTDPEKKVIEVPTDKTNYGPPVGSLQTMEEDLKA